MSKRTPRQDVWCSLAASGMPAALCEGILNVLVEAGYDKLAINHVARNTFAPMTDVEGIIPHFIDKIAAINSCPSYEERQLSYHYSRWAVGQYRRLSNLGG